MFAIGKGSFATMKSTLVLAATFALLVFCFATANEENSQETAQDVPTFVKTLRNLQRGPPNLPVTKRANIVTEWILQKLDHFNDTDTRTWQMRYMSNSEYFKANGPLFIYIGGEWEISPGSISSGHFVDMAREHNGYLFYTEHRYYGYSWPTDDIRTEYLKYQHVKQALADLAHFIRTKKASVPEMNNSKVIIAGGSYSATMTVWMKRLYPELITGGWASSAPLLAKVNFIEYKEVVGKAFKELGSEKCYNRIQNGIAELEYLMDNGRAAEVKAMLKLCNTFDEKNDLDVWSLFGSISNVYSGIAQYQRDGDIPAYCDYLMSFEDDLMAVSNFALWAFGAPTCNDLSYKSTVGFYLDSSYAYGASRPWYYQTCNEYGWYQSSGSQNQPFGKKFPATLYTQLCEDVFGPAFTNENINANVAETNNFFGGMSPQVTDIYQTHGALDPWSPMGLSELQGANVIPRASHCADFGSISSADSAEMRASKERVAALVREWLA